MDTDRKAPSVESSGERWAWLPGNIGRKCAHKRMIGRAFVFSRLAVSAWQFRKLTPKRESRLPEKLCEVSWENRRGPSFWRAVAHCWKNCRRVHRKLAQHHRKRQGPHSQIRRQIDNGRNRVTRQPNSGAEQVACKLGRKKARGAESLLSRHCVTSAVALYPSPSLRPQNIFPDSSEPDLDRLIQKR